MISPLLETKLDSPSSTPPLRATPTFLSELFGGSQWKRCQDLLKYPQDSLSRNAQVMTSILGNLKWKRHPNLLLSHYARVQAYAEHHTIVYGGTGWMVMPALTTVTPRTFQTDLRMLAYFEISPAKQGDIIAPVLSLSAETFRKKAEMIRIRILRHQHIYSVLRPKSLKEYCDFRKGLTPAQKEGERKELRELAQFLRRYVRTLTLSEDAIRAKAVNKVFKKRLAELRESVGSYPSN